MWGREEGGRCKRSPTGGAKKGKMEKGESARAQSRAQWALDERCCIFAAHLLQVKAPLEIDRRQILHRLEPFRALLAVANLPVTLLSAESPTGCSSRPFTVKLHKCSQFFLLVEPSHWLKGSIIHLQYKARGASPLILGPQTTECDWLFSSTLGIWHLALTPRFLQQSLACYPVSAAGATHLRSTTPAPPCDLFLQPHSQPIRHLVAISALSDPCFLCVCLGLTCVS